MRVIAAQGLKVPKETNPREYIDDTQAQEIDVTAYYLRRLADCELVEVAAEQANPTDAAAPRGKAAK